MKKITLKSLILSFFLVALNSCGGGGSGGNGQLVGVQNRPGWNHIFPFGMVYIPSGTLHIGPGDQDVNFALVHRSKSISIQGFYMDDTEISNNEYRQFVYWVRDSMAHKLLGEEHLIETEDGEERINWRARIEWKDPETSEILEELYYSEDERYWGNKQIDVSKLNYQYEWIDLRAASKRENNSKPRSEFIRKENVNIYPDTLVWIRDFSYSYNEPMARQYFWHPAFDNYPLVGVLWPQANAFCAWRTQLWNNFRRMQGLAKTDEFRLPYEAEWEYASRGGKKNSPYPWGGPYIRNAKGCILANFKPGRGNYPDDGGFYTVRVDAYWPNDFGLYNISGNVSELTSTAYDESAYSFVHDLNPYLYYEAEQDDPEALKRKVIRGGSWKDIGYFLQNGTRSYEYQDTAKSYVGFRCVQTFLGRSMKD